MHTYGYESRYTVPNCRTFPTGGRSTALSTVLSIRGILSFPRLTKKVLNEVRNTTIDSHRLNPISDSSVAHLIKTLQEETSIALLLAGGDWHKRYPSGLVTEMIQACPIECCPVLLYGPSEADEYSTYLNEWSLARTAPLHVFTGNLSDVIHVLRACSGAVGNDCGLMHIAVALGLPILSLFGPSEPVAWFPYRDVETQRFLVANTPCRPCYGHERGFAMRIFAWLSLVQGGFKLKCNF